MWAVTPDAAPTVFTVGDLNADSTAALAEALWSHMFTAPPHTVLDLGPANVLGDEGVDLVAAVAAYTVHRGLAFDVINAATDVRRTLRAAGVMTTSTAKR